LKSLRSLLLLLLSSDLEVVTQVLSVTFRCSTASFEHFVVEEVLLEELLPRHAVEELLSI
jgi:hypothetical protein